MTHIAIGSIRGRIGAAEDQRPDKEDPEPQVTSIRALRGPVEDTPLPEEDRGSPAERRARRTERRVERRRADPAAEAFDFGRRVIENIPRVIEAAVPTGPIGVEERRVFQRGREEIGRRFGPEAEFVAGLQPFAPATRTEAALELAFLPLAAVGGGGIARGAARGAGELGLGRIAARALGEEAAESAARGAGRQVLGRTATQRAVRESGEELSERLARELTEETTETGLRRAGVEGAGEASRPFTRVTRQLDEIAEATRAAGRRSAGFIRRHPVGSAAAAGVAAGAGGGLLLSTVIGGDDPATDPSGGGRRPTGDGDGGVNGNGDGNGGGGGGQPGTNGDGGGFGPGGETILFPELFGGLNLGFLDRIAEGLADTLRGLGIPAGKGLGWAIMVGGTAILLGVAVTQAAPGIAQLGASKARKSGSSSSSSSGSSGTGKMVEFKTKGGKTVKFKAQK